MFTLLDLAIYSSLLVAFLLLIWVLGHLLHRQKKLKKKIDLVVEKLESIDAQLIELYVFKQFFMAARPEKKIAIESKPDRKEEKPKRGRPRKVKD